MTANEWLMILGMMVVTFGIRYVLFALADHVKIPALIESSLRFIPPAVLIAITVPAVLLPNGKWHLSWTNPYLVSAAIATGAGILTKKLLLTIAVGLFTFFLYRFIVS